MRPTPKFDGERIAKLHAEIIAELPPEERHGLFPCLKCRKMVRDDGSGNWYCECHDERPQENPR